MSASSPESTESTVKQVVIAKGPGKASEQDEHKIVKPVQYKLQCGPLEYADDKGDFQKAGFIMLYEPAGRNRDACTVLEQLFLRALRQNKKLASEVVVPKEEIEAALKLLKERRDEAAKRGVSDAAVAEPGDNSEGFTGPDILQMVGSTSISLGEVINGVRRLICDTGLARIDDSVNLTPTIADDMPWRELRGVVGAYLAGFTVPSALDST